MSHVRTQVPVLRRPVSTWRRRGRKGGQDEDLILASLLKQRRDKDNSQTGEIQTAVQRPGWASAQTQQTVERLGQVLGNRGLAQLYSTASKTTPELQRQEQEGGAAAAATPEIVQAASQYPEAWGDKVSVQANGVSIDVFGATGDQQKIIEDTLSLLPRDHLEEIPRIVVNERVGPVGVGNVTRGGNSVRHGNAESDRIELTTYALENKIKEVGSTHVKTCITLLHEIGHWVDWDLTILPPRDSEEYARLQAWFGGLEYQGVTRGAGEQAAEAYWRYFASNLPSEIREILNKSPAFEGLFGG